VHYELQTMKYQRRLICLVMAAFVLLACEFVQGMGTLLADGTPVVFTAKGETDHQWQVIVEPRSTYELVVSAESPQADQVWASVIVCSVAGDICPDGAVIASVSSYEEVTSLCFKTEDQTMLYVHVFASLEERGRPGGEYSISLSVRGDECLE
jgi:hypothetical protein